MADTGKPVAYRGFDLNTVDIVPGQAIGDGLMGCTLDSIDYSDVDVVEFTEKRSLEDGLDAGAVFLGARRVRMAGTLYDTTRPALFDRLQQLKSAMSATLSFRQDPSVKGYQPLTFEVPTLNLDPTTGYPGGIIYQQLFALPKSLHVTFTRDQIGSNDLDPLALPWQASMVCRNPTILSQTVTDTAFSATTLVTGVTATASTDLVNKTSHGLSAGDRIYFTALTGGTPLVVGTGYYVISSGLTTSSFKLSLTSGGAAIDVTVDGSSMTYVKIVTLSGNFINRGDYHTPLNFLFVIGATGGVITVSGGGSNFTLTIPTSANARIVRVKGEDKIATIEELGLEPLTMSIIDFQNATTWPLVPGGTSPWTISISGVVLTDTNSHMWFSEAYS